MTLKSCMTPKERVLCALDHKEGDRVPLVLLFSYYGAKVLDMSIQDYFSNPENIIKAQVLLQEKYQTDCYYAFYYAALELEAFGGRVLFSEDGPPNNDGYVIHDRSDIFDLSIPDVATNPHLQKVIATIKGLKLKAGEAIPIIGGVIAPFSLPVLQMGFEAYLNLIYFDPEGFNVLMEKNSSFCIAWANAQIEAGASAIGYSNPLASPNIIERKTYLEKGYPIDQKTLSKIKGSKAMHLASGIALPVMDDLMTLDIHAVGIGPEDSLAELKIKSKGKVALLGNLNGLEMVHWSERTIKEKVKHLIQIAGQSGGLLISDSHGEIPWQVPDSVLQVISETLRQEGTYPIH